MYSERDEATLRTFTVEVPRSCIHAGRITQTGRAGWYILQGERDGDVIPLAADDVSFYRTLITKFHVNIYFFGSKVRRQGEPDESFYRILHIQFHQK